MAAAVLHRTRRSNGRNDEFAHDAINSATISPPSAARSCSAKVLGIDREERHAVAGFQQENRITVQLVGSHGGPSQQMPAARAGETLDTRLHAADRNRAGRCQQARILPPRHVQEFVEAAEIGPSRREADHGDAVVAGDMSRHDVVGRGLERFGDILEIDAVLAAIGHGNAPAPRFCRRGNRELRESGKLFAERVEIDHHGIVMHQQRPIGRHRLRHARDRLVRQRAIERQHPLVRGIVDVATEFHRDGAVATRQKTGRGECRDHGLTSLRRISSSVFCREVEFASRKWACKFNKLIRMIVIRCAD